MKVRELTCWPPKWAVVAPGPGNPPPGGEGVLTAVRMNPGARALTLSMEVAGDRYSAVLQGEAKLLTTLSLLLDWQVGRPLAKIANLELAP